MLYNKICIIIFINGRMKTLTFWDSAFETIRKFFTVFRITDLIDILIVAYIAYKAIKLVKETRAGQLVKGIVVIVVIMQLSQWFQLNTINYILKNTMQVGLVALLVVFQPELRRALEKVGRSRLSSFFSNSDDYVEDMVEEISEAVRFLSAEKIGALLVFERETKLGEILNSGTEIKAKITAPLLINLFIPNTPLHDGATVIREGKIHSSACILPLTGNDMLSHELGTRHRAALGVTENSDCVVVVVSEETGKISFVENGDMVRSLSVENMAQMLTKALTKESAQAKNAGGVFRWLKK